MKTRNKAKAKPAAESNDDFPDFATGNEFDALSDADKEKVWKYYDDGRHLNEMRPLNAAEMALVRRQKRGMGRPRIGKGAKVVSMSVERDLLKRADAYAKAHGLKRAELFSQAVRGVLAKKQAV